MLHPKARVVHTLSIVSNRHTTTHTTLDNAQPRELIATRTEHRTTHLSSHTLLCARLESYFFVAISILVPLP